MKCNYTGFVCLSLIIFFVTFITSGCGEPEITSRWLDREILIDGANTEWGYFIQYYHERTRANVCIFNDNNYLYIKISTSDRITQTQLISLGLTVWFDPDNRKQKIFGIHCPLGVREKGIPVLSGRVNRTDEQFEKMIQDTQNELEIISSIHGKPIKISLLEAEHDGVDCKLGMTNGILVYELKVPLTRNDQHPYAVGIEAGKTMDIGFETGKNDVENMKKSIPEEKSTSASDDTTGYSGRMRPPDKRRGGMPPAGMTGEITEQLNLWVEVTLATELY